MARRRLAVACLVLIVAALAQRANAQVSSWHPRNFLRGNRQPNVVVDPAEEVDDAVVDAAAPPPESDAEPSANVPPVGAEDAEPEEEGVARRGDSDDDAATSGMRRGSRDATP